MCFDVATGSTQIMPSRHALNLAWGEHWACNYVTHQNSNCVIFNTYHKLDISALPAPHLCAHAEYQSGPAQ